MRNYVDFRKLYENRDFNQWFLNEATEQERKLFETVSEYSEEYFADFRFEEGSAVDAFIRAETSDDNGNTWENCYVQIPEELDSFSELVLPIFTYKVERIPGGFWGGINLKNYTMVVDQEHFDDKATILHEIIHLYEMVLDALPNFYHDVLYLCLYKKLMKEVPDLDDRITAHSHVLYGQEITIRGGDHDILFLLKSFELDLRCGYKLGTVCGYGRDQY